MSRMNSNEEERINNLKKLHIGKLKAHEPLNEETLKEYFQQFGEVVNLNIPKENQGKQAEGETPPLKGYGFVEFATLEAAKKCVRTKTHTFGEKELHVHRSIPREQLYLLNDARSDGDVKVFLRNKDSFTEKQLTDFFSNHSTLPMEPSKVTFPKDSQDKPKGFAILEFPHEDDCICLVTVGKLKIEKEGGQHKELHPAFYVKNNNRRYRGGYGGGFNNYGRGGWNQGYGYGYYDDYGYYCDYDDYGYHGGYGGYGNYGGYEPNYGPYSGGGYGRRYGGGGGRPYPGSGGGGGGGGGGGSGGGGRGRRGGDYA